MKDFSIKKLYYSISEVSKITEVEQYVLRYWETEFEQLKPQKNRAGNRAYTNKDIQTILQIKSLLREKKYTIEGARVVLNQVPKTKGNVIENVQSEEVKNEISSLQTLEKIVDEKIDRNLTEDLIEIKKFLELLLTKL
ncbi:MAG TPA: MerR family transcriptional regulator [Ignavibacteriaceae bacterium]|nr:MerR family transcriptional regulator [Ignavibacteriaceae bacterium]